jgi:hypothetical protein
MRVIIFAGPTIQKDQIWEQTADRTDTENLAGGLRVKYNLTRTLALQAAFSRSAISLKIFELGMPSSFAIARPVRP